jgi:hypothetical protein
MNSFSGFEGDAPIGIDNTGTPQVQVSHGDTSRSEATMLRADLVSLAGLSNNVWCLRWILI